jgi:hypothetical protein
MPKKPNAKKIAARAVRQSSALDRALAGELPVALIDKCLGFGKFLVSLDSKTQKEVAITSAVLRCGQSGASYARPSHWLVIDGPEVVGVVNTRADLRQLERAGVLPPSLVGKTKSCLEEYFEMEQNSDDEDPETDIWAGAGAKSKAARQTAEAAAQAEELVARYRRRNAGLKERSAAPLVGTAEVAAPTRLDEADAEDGAEEAPAVVDAADAEAARMAAARAKPVTSERRLRKERVEQLRLFHAARRIQRLVRACLAARAAYWAEQARREEEEERVAAEFAEFSKKAAEAENWEALIDAI